MFKILAGSLTLIIMCGSSLGKSSNTESIHDEKDIVTENPSMNTVIACEGHMAVLDCAVSGKTISIINANYGRSQPGNICPSSAIKTTECFAIDSTTKVIQRCEEKSNCALEASNRIFGDPCFGTYKYLEVEFNCD